MSTRLRVFISHSTSDIELAKRLIELLRAAFNLHSTDIRCTSVDNYRLPIGVDTDEQLRREVHEAEVFIGIVSANSLRSLYVLFELGARWGAKKQLMPLLSPGTGTSVLGGPLAGLNALRADSRLQLHQLVTDVGAALKAEPESPAVYEEHIGALLKMEPVLADIATPPSVSHTLPPPPPNIAVTAYSGSEAILLVQNTGGEATFAAEARILSVEPGTIGHAAPYRLLWKDCETHEVLKGHKQAIPADGRLKLLLSTWESGGDWGKPSITVLGDEWAVDHYRHESWERSSPAVTIDVTISATPALSAPFRARYVTYIPARTISKVVVESAPSE